MQANHMPGSAARQAKLRLLAARLVWVGVVGLNLVLFFVSMPYGYAAHLAAAGPYQAALAQLGLTAPFYAVYRLSLDLLQVIAFTLTGALIFWRKSNDVFVIWVSLTCITFGSLFVPTLLPLAESHPGWLGLVGFLRAMGLASSLLVFFYLFPNGRFVPGPARLLAVLWIGLTVYWFLFPQAPYNIVYLATWTANLPVSVGLLLFWFVSGMLAQAYRFWRVSTPAQRQQTKWAVLGTSMAVLGFAAYHLPLFVLPVMAVPGVERLLYALVGVPLYHAMVLLAPLSIGIAILRYHLWEIDLLINRSLVYAALTVTLLVVYFGSVISLQALISILWGGGSRLPELETIFSTLVIAGLFFPLRARIQTSIDRRFYRQKYSAEKALIEFSESLRHEVDLAHLRQRLMEVVHETMQPKTVNLWLKGSETNDPDKL